MSDDITAKTGLTPAERKLRAQLAAHTKWALCPDRTAATAKARSALFKTFLDQCDGDAQRAESLWKAHFKAMALKSAVARRKAAA